MAIKIRNISCILLHNAPCRQLHIQHLLDIKAVDGARNRYRSSLCGKAPTSGRA